MKISIVMAYYNRKNRLKITLDSITHTQYPKKDIEVIIVDDGSDEDHRIEDFIKIYPFEVRVLRLSPENKWYCNPCIPFNKGFDMATGEIIIIQNPECCHVGDVVSVASQVKQNQYFNFHAYSLDLEETESLTKENIKNIESLPFNLKDIGTGIEGRSGYYNHYKLRPVGFHFCSAIRKEDLDDLGGFDERYAEGTGYDDNEFLHRILKKKMSLLFVPNPLVLHQNHYNSKNGNFQQAFADSKVLDRIKKNETLFTEVTMKEEGWKAMRGFSRIPKIAHFYWEGDKFSYLHFLSVKSFLDKNPKWKAIMHTNRIQQKTEDNAWKTGEQKAIYTGKNYFSKLKELNIEINEIDFTQLGIKSDLHPVHKSDILRWHLLGTVGGAWIDSDILHLKPLEHLSKYINKNCGGAVCWTQTPIPHYVIGFFLSEANNPFFQKLFDESLKENQVDYQMYGNRLIEKNFRNFTDIVTAFPNLNMNNFNFEHFYIHPWLEVNQLFEEKHEKFKENHVVGVHWYNGDPRATAFYNNFDEDYLIEKPKTTIEEIIYECTKTDS